MALVNRLNSDYNDSLCGREIPAAKDAFDQFRNIGIGAAVIGSLLVMVTIGLYIEEIIFILKRFVIEERKNRTIWILGLYPILSTCSFIGAMVPRSAVFVDMVSAIYLATSLYMFLMLLESYMGGRERMWEILKDNTIDPRSPPCCCCCRCLPVRPFNSTYRRLVIMTLQVAIIRPILMFVAAVMWADGSYAPGVVGPRSAYTYIMGLNLISLIFSIYGLIIMRRTFSETLKEFSITGKMVTFQLCLMVGTIPNSILSIVVLTGTLPCLGVLNTISRSQRISNALEVILFFILALVARRFYRRAQDGSKIAGSEEEGGHTGTGKPHDLQAVNE